MLSITSAQSHLLHLDFGAIGGTILLVDMMLFSALACYWEEAARIRLPIFRRRGGNGP